jgi:hypothetical protein
MKLRRARLCPVFACVFVGCIVSSVPSVTQAQVRPAATLRRDVLDPQVEQRLLALDPQRISEQDVQEVLARVPAPRIIALHGSVPIHTMAPFAEFLVAMGYPAERLRNPRDGRLTYSSFVDSREVAGAIAWHYERDGVMPLLIGHSQGGMLALKVLQDLAGASGEQLPVWSPALGAAENRSTIIDPRTGEEREVIGLKVPYAAALATGSVMRVLLGQWGMLARLRSVPDSVEEFTGYFIAWDPFAGTGPDAARDNPYRATGLATVRNVMLPSDYGHITLPLARHLADDPATRQWIGSFDPTVQPAEPPAMPGADLRNIVLAADIWFSVKKSWCLEAQRYARATQALRQARN